MKNHTLSHISFRHSRFIGFEVLKRKQAAGVLVSCMYMSLCLFPNLFNVPVAGNVHGRRAGARAFLRAGRIQSEVGRRGAHVSSFVSLQLRGQLFARRKASYQKLGEWSHNCVFLSGFFLGSWIVFCISLFLIIAFVDFLQLLRVHRPWVSWVGWRATTAAQPSRRRYFVALSLHSVAWPRSEERPRQGLITLLPVDFDVIPIRDHLYHLARCAPWPSPAPPPPPKGAA